jgi:TonB family protein
MRSNNHVARRCTVVAAWFARVFLIAAVVMFAGRKVAYAEPQNAGPDRIISFDIPRQALDDALQAYIDASGEQVLYETTLTAGKQSQLLKGRLTSSEALRRLLSGTGLIGRRADIDAFVITAADPADLSPSFATISRSGQFAGALQAGIVNALCNSLQTRLGGYKVALELWIGPAGNIERSSLIGSTGDSGRDVAVLSALQTMTVAVPPPANMPQPIVISVTPRSAGDCVR